MEKRVISGTKIQPGLFHLVCILIVSVLLAWTIWWWFDYRLERIDAQIEMNRNEKQVTD